MLCPPMARSRSTRFLDCPRTMYRPSSSATQSCSHCKRVTTLSVLLHVKMERLLTSHGLYQKTGFTRTFWTFKPEIPLSLVWRLRFRFNISRWSRLGEKAKGGRLLVGQEEVEAE